MKKSEQSKDQPLLSLKEFIEQNHKIISSIGIFIALTVFSSNLKSTYFSIGLSFLFLLLTTMIWIELIGQFPKHGSNLLGWFEAILGITFFALIGYWIVEYYKVWILVLPYIIQLMFIGIVGYFIKKFDLFNRVFRTKQGGKITLRYIVYFVIMLFVVSLGLMLGNCISPYIADVLKQTIIFVH